jgi:Nif-specific regulatory protein
MTWQEMEERYIAAVLDHHDGNRTAAARAMGIGRNTLLRKIKQYGLS